MIPFKDNILNDRTPLVTLALILANVVVYGLVAGHGGSLISGPDAHELARYGASPHAFTVKTAFTSLFVNPSIVQLVGNMVFLWIFGNTVEDAMGPIRFLAFYLAGGLAAIGLLVAFDHASTVPTAGPAGAVAAVIGGYALIYPRARVLWLVLIPLFFGVVEVPTAVMVGLWLAMQALFGDGVATYLVHLATLGLGGVAVRLLATRRKPTPPTAAAYR